MDRTYLDLGLRFGPARKIHISFSSALTRPSSGPRPAARTALRPLRSNHFYFLRSLRRSRLLSLSSSSIAPNLTSLALSFLSQFNHYCTLRPKPLPPRLVRFLAFELAPLAPCLALALPCLVSLLLAHVSVALPHLKLYHITSIFGFCCHAYSRLQKICVIEDGRQAARPSGAAPPPRRTSLTGLSPLASSHCPHALPLSTTLDSPS